MNRRKLKKQIIMLLQSDDLDEMRRQLQDLPQSNLLNALFSCLCHSDELVRWHAVSGFGFIVPAIAEKELETARTVMRRFLWMLNDESGGIGWGVPEAMAEVMFHSTPLGREYLHMLVSYTRDDGPELFQDGNFLELDLMQEGVLWGLCRVAPVYRSKMLKHRLDDNLEVYFHSTSARVRGLVCRLSGVLRLQKYRTFLYGACEDVNPVRFYHEGRFMERTVSELARTALKNL